MIVSSAAASGVKPEVLERATGFSAASAADPDARISLEVETTLWDEAARQTRDADFGLHTAERLQPGVFDVLDYVIRTAPTARVAMERLARYNRLEHDLAVFSMHDRGPVTRIEHAFGDGSHVQSRHAAEFTLAAQIVVGSQITGTRMVPRTVELTHARPASVAEHLRVLGVTPTFSVAINALEWDRAVLERPVPASDPALARTLLRHADALLAARPVPSTSYADRVRRILATNLGEGDASLKRVARDLKMSERSLQRRLTADGVTFDSLLDEMRHQLSLRYLADPQIAISEVAYLLGYSEPSPFHRAFKRWTGVTASEVRQRAA
ncbi:MAG: Transcriptional regulator, AraC family [Myxococcales bacterium]|nr:Transcriptional regulator, AraC family [Myxococcales bacterium]